MNTTLPLVKPARSWAITDLGIYVSAHYSSVIGVRAECEYFRMHHVRIRAAGFDPVASFNPYWDRNGVTFEDPDGYRIVLNNEAWST